jgi:hypothetical protein
MNTERLQYLLDYLDRLINLNKMYVVENNITNVLKEIDKELMKK